MNTCTHYDSKNDLLQSNHSIEKTLQLAPSLDELWRRRSSKNNNKDFSHVRDSIQEISNPFNLKRELPSFYFKKIDLRHHGTTDNSVEIRTGGTNQTRNTEAMLEESTSDFRTIDGSEPRSKPSDDNNSRPTYFDNSSNFVIKSNLNHKALQAKTSLEQKELKKKNSFTKLNLGVKLSVISKKSSEFVRSIGSISRLSQIQNQLSVNEKTKAAPAEAPNPFEANYSPSYMMLHGYDNTNLLEEVMKASSAHLKKAEESRRDSFKFSSPRLNQAIEKGVPFDSIKADDEFLVKNDQSSGNIHNFIENQGAPLKLSNVLKISSSSPELQNVLRDVSPKDVSPDSIQKDTQRNSTMRVKSLYQNATHSYHDETNMLKRIKSYDNSTFQSNNWRLTKVTRITNMSNPAAPTTSAFNGLETSNQDLLK